MLDVLTHRSGLPAVSVSVAPGSLYDWDAMVGMLAASSPVLPARAQPVYHNMTFGHLVGQILLKATAASSLTTLLDDELLRPLGVDFALGMTPNQANRAAWITQKIRR